MAEKEIWTIGKILKWTEQYFAKAGIDGARLDAEVLLSHVLNKERIFLKKSLSPIQFGFPFN